MKWTAEQDKQLRQLAAQGKASSVIGWHLGCTKNAIIGRAHRIGAALTRKGPEISAEGRARAAATRLLRVAVTLVIRDPAKTIGTDNGDAIFRLMWARGDSARTMSAHFGCHDNTVTKARKRMGLAPRHQYPPKNSAPFVLAAPPKYRSVHSSQRTDLTPKTTLPPMARAEPDHPPLDARPATTGAAVTRYLARAPSICQWPTGNGPFVFACCDASGPGRSYCEEHAKIAYVFRRHMREDNGALR